MRVECNECHGIFVMFDVKALSQEPCPECCAQGSLQEIIEVKEVDVMMHFCDLCRYYHVNVNRNPCASCESINYDKPEKMDDMFEPSDIVGLK